MCRLLVQSHIRTCQPHFGVITCFLQKTARSVCEHHTTLRKLSSSRLSSVQSVETSAWIIAQSVQLISWRLFSMLAEFGCFVHGNACFSLIESPLYKFVTADNSLVWSTSYIPTITCWQLLECVVHPWNTSIQRPSGGMSYIHFNTSQESGLSLSLSLVSCDTTGSRHTSEIVPEPLGPRWGTSFTKFSPTFYAGLEKSSCR